MKNKPKHFRNINSKNVIISAVALVLLLVISVFAVSSWVETISTIIIQGDLAIDSPVYTNASIKSDSKDSIDLAKYFREAGNVHLSEASSADGINFYFPILDSTNYRQNNINDINVNYINFKLKVKSDADKSFVFNQEPTIKIGGNKISNSAVRVAISLDGITQIFSLAESTESVVASKSGSPLQPTNVLKFSDFLSQNANNNKVFFLSKNSEKELTISIWLQQGIAGDVSGKEIAIENLSLVPDTPRYRIEATAITDGVTNVVTGGTVKVGEAAAGAYSSENIEVGKTVTLVAKVSSSGYLFTGLYNSETGGTVVKEPDSVSSDGLTYTYTLESKGDCHYYARFAKGYKVMLFNELYNVDTNKVTVNTTCGSVKAGSATAGNQSQTTVANGETVKLTATALSGYKFLGWYEMPTSGVPGSLISKDNPYNVTVNAEMRLHARFAASTLFKAHAVSNNTSDSSTGGTVSLNGATASNTSSYEAIKNETITAVAVAKEGYEFVGWYDGSGESATYLSNKLTYEFTAASDAPVNVYAKFYSKHTITVYAQYNGNNEDTTGGTVQVSSGEIGGKSEAIAQYGSGISVYASLSDASKYKFDGWFDEDGNKLNSIDSTTYNFDVDGDKVIYGRFSLLGKTLYFQPSSSWAADSARFAAYAFNDSTNSYEWFDMTSSDTSGVYQVVVPNNYTHVVFARMNPNTVENNWDNRWADDKLLAQTYDLEIPSNNNNLYKQSNGFTRTGIWLVNPDDVTGSTVTITLKDSTNKKWLNNSTPYFVLVDDATGNTYKATSSTSTSWTFKVPSTVTDITFKRLEPGNLSNAWNSWSPSGRGTKKTFTVYDSSSSWS